MNLEDLSFVGSEAAGQLLELVADVNKLHVLLCEMEEEEIAVLRVRLSAFFAAVRALPVQLVEKDLINWIGTVGEA